MRKIITLGITVCTTAIVFAQQFSVAGKFTGFKNGTKFFLKDPETLLIIDSTILVDNSFIIKGQLSDTPKSIWLSTTTDKTYYWCNLFIGNEKVLIKGDRKDFPFYLNITGSKSQDVYNILDSKTKSLKTQRNTLTENIWQLVTDESDSGKAKLETVGKQLRHIDSLTNAIRITFIKSNLNSYAALNELYFLKTSFSKDSLQKMYNRLELNYKQSIYGQRILNYLKVGDILKVGDMFSNFEAIDQFGKMHKLSELKEKYILLDFTETYCGPCILAVDELKKISQTYADKLNIVSFWADKSKEVWNEGVLRDKLSWLCLWDGEGHYGETLLKYGVYGYPTFFLIDPNGKIVSQWTGYGKGDIENKIAQNLK